MIDLILIKPEIINFIIKSVNDFITKHPNVKTSVIGLYSCPWAGWITINFDTEKYPDNMDTLIPNCPDFKYVDFSYTRFPDWQEQYNTNDIITLNDGSENFPVINLLSDGDEALNKVFFNYYIHLMAELENDGLFRLISPHEKLIIGVQLLDSQYEKFWVTTKQRIN